MNNKEILKLLLSKEQIRDLKEVLIKLLAKHVGTDVTMIEAIAIKDIFEVGFEELTKEAK